jgi:DNA-binding FadR family transcriptional regulator
MDDSVQNTINNMLELLKSDRFPLQSRLPSERALSTKLKVSRATLRKALAILEDERRIWRHIGRGTFVGPRPELNEDEIINIKSATNPTEIMEARLVLEPRLAALAALRATIKELSQLNKILDRSLNAVATTEFEHFDGLLHQTIAKATHNSLLISIFSVINKVRESEIWGSLKKASLSNEHRKIYNHQHKVLVESIVNRDIEQSERLMREHLKSVSKHLLEIQK